MGNVPERIAPDKKQSAFWLRQHIGRYVFAAQFANGTVLDIACGPGYGAKYLMNSVAKTVVGGDYSEQAIQHARLHYSQDGLSFLRLDAQQLPFRDNSFDVVVSLETIEHLERYKDFLHACKQMLKEDGIFICSTPNSRATLGSRDPYHFKEFSVGEFYELIAGYFTEVKLYGQDFLKRIDILKRELIWRIMPLIYLIPQSIQNSLRKLFFPENYLVSLAEIYKNYNGRLDKVIDGKYIPSLLTQSYPLPGTIVAVAKKQRINKRQNTNV